MTQGKRVFRRLLVGEKRVLFVNNATEHKLTKESWAALSESNTETRFLPKNATDFCQLADSCITQKLKTAWRSAWDHKRMGMVESQSWTNWKNESSKLSNAGQRFYLELASKVLKDVDSQKDSDGFLYTQKAMIRCGLALNLNRRWVVKQLFPHPKEIVKKHGENFEGKTVAYSMELDGTVTETD